MRNIIFHYYNIEFLRESFSSLFERIPVGVWIPSSREHISSEGKPFIAKRLLRITLNSKLIYIIDWVAPLVTEPP